MNSIVVWTTAECTLNRITFRHWNRIIVIDNYAKFYYILACCQTYLAIHPLLFFHLFFILFFAFCSTLAAMYILLCYVGHSKICQRQKTMQTKGNFFEGIVFHENCDWIFRFRYYNEIDIFGHFVLLHIGNGHKQIGIENVLWNSFPSTTANFVHEFGFWREI